MDDDAELEAIRARMRAQIMQEAQATPAAAAPDHPLDVDDRGFQALLAEQRALVVDCWAPWCGPCRIVGPTIDQLAREMSGRVTFAKLNVDDNPGVSQAFGIQSIPTLLFFKDGRLVDRVVGVLPKPQLASRVERALLRPGGTPGPRRM